VVRGDASERADAAGAVVDDGVNGAGVAVGDDGGEGAAERQAQQQRPTG